LISSSTILKSARRTIDLEATSLKQMGERLGEEFSSTVECVFNCKGRLVITGIGKSAIVAQKIVATLNSTGTPSIFMHAADAIHGDLGLIQEPDIVMCISKSGNTEEIKVLIPLIKGDGTPLIGMTGNPDSRLAREADFVLDTRVDKEACPNNLAPTASTTAQMVMGDALAIALLELRGFDRSDFARFHPGGSLGKQLYLRSRDIAANNQRPEVQPDTPVKEVILEISRNMLGAAAVTEEGRLLGIVTDGDIRRMLNSYGDISGVCARDIMNTSPKTVEGNELAVRSLEVIQEHNISQLIVLEKGKYSGMIHFHNLMQEGII
jgi:arabinose-5-phosphate isomerase